VKAKPLRCSSSLELFQRTIARHVPVHAPTGRSQLAHRSQRPGGCRTGGSADGPHLVGRSAAPNARRVL